MVECRKRVRKFAIAAVIILFGLFCLDMCVFADDIVSPVYKSPDISLLGNYGEEDLSGIEKAIYNELKAKIKAVADGEESSTKFEIPVERLGIKSVWTKEELGITGELLEGNKLTDETRTALIEQIFSQDNSKIFHLLLVNYPYDFYWFDKTVGTGYTLLPSRMTISKDGSSLTFTGGLVYEYTVAIDYRDGDDAFKVSQVKVQSAEKALRNAQEVIKKNAGKSDYEKLLSYRDEICSLASYDVDAAGGNYNSGYGDPWQIIYVFDHNPETKVVCEGYAKAFQYLYDESQFSGNVCVYTVTGWLDSGAGKVPHMWNIVSVDQKNYLVDITSWDGGLISDSEAFLLGSETGSVKDGYTFRIHGRDIVYTYDKETLSLYGGSILALYPKNYGWEENSSGSEEEEMPDEEYESEGKEEKEAMIEQEQSEKEDSLADELEIEVQREKTFIRNAAVKTGDDEKPGRWLLLLSISGMVMVGTINIRLRLKVKRI